MKFNINDYVKVKLNESGLEILRKQHEELQQMFPSMNKEEFVPPKTDENGYTKFQLWVLMERFGPEIGMSFNPPFETDIIIMEENV